MIHATIDVDLRDHWRAIRACKLAGSPAPMGLWLDGMLYDKKHMTSGEIPRDVIERSPWCSGAEQAEQLGGILVEVGLWVVAENGWKVFNHAKKNETKEQIEARITAKRERDRKRYQKKKFTKIPPSIPPNSAERNPSVPRADSVNGDVNVNVVGSGSDPEGVQREPTVEPEGFAEPDRVPTPIHVRYAEAYAEGQRLAGAEVYPPPVSRRDQADLAELALALRAPRGKTVDAIRDLSTEYRRARPGAAVYTRGWSPGACLDWIRGGKPPDPPVSGTFRRQTLDLSDLPPAAPTKPFGADEYEAGMREGLGAPFAWSWKPWDHAPMARAISEFAEYGDGERVPETEADDRRKWVQLAAVDFAKFVLRRDKARPMGKLGPEQFLEWLVEDTARRRQAREARAVP